MLLTFGCHHSIFNTDKERDKNDWSFSRRLGIRNRGQTGGHFGGSFGSMD